MDSKLIWIIVVIAAAAAVYVFMREKINLRKAAGGEGQGTAQESRGPGSAGRERVSGGLWSF